MKTIDEYIAAAPQEVQTTLHQLRRTIADAAPEAEEKISWGMATFGYHGNLVHFSAEKRHIGFHPSPSAIAAFRPELAHYHCSKGTVQFPYDRPIPLELVKKMVRFRIKEQQQMAAAKKAGKDTKRALRPRYPMPDDIDQALEQQGLRAEYEARPPYQRNDYIGWITRAKRPQTRQKRLDQMLMELRSGDAYMGMEYHTGKKFKKRQQP